MSAKLALSDQGATVKTSSPLDYLRIYVNDDAEAFAHTVVVNYPKRIKSSSATAKDGTRPARITDVAQSARLAAQRAGFDEAAVRQVSLAAWRVALDLGFSSAGMGRR